MVPAGSLVPENTDPYFEVTPTASSLPENSIPPTMHVAMHVADPYTEEMTPSGNSNDNDDPYLEMTPVGSTPSLNADPYMDMSPAGPSGQSKDLLYVDMTPSAGTSPSNSGYFEMASTVADRSRGTLVDTAYMDMNAAGIY